MPAVDRGARLDVVRAADVADDDESGRGSRCAASKPVMQPDAPALERRPHRRVERHVGARHVVPGGLEEPGERAHAGAGDGDEVNVHRGDSEGRGGAWPPPIRREGNRPSPPRRHARAPEPRVSASRPSLFTCASTGSAHRDNDCLAFWERRLRIRSRFMIGTLILILRSGRQKTLARNCGPMLIVALGRGASHWPAPHRGALTSLRADVAGHAGRDAWHCARVRAAGRAGEAGRARARVAGRRREVGLASALSADLAGAARIPALATVARVAQGIGRREANALAVGLPDLLAGRVHARPVDAFRVLKALASAAIADRSAVESSSRDPRRSPRSR